MSVSNNATTCGTDSTFLSQLRTATKQLHAQLDSAPLSASIMSDSLTAADYTTYLQRFEPVVAFTEQYIFPLVRDVIPDLDERRKHAAIKSDLTVLNAQLKANHFTTGKVRSTARAMGYMYVMEGSTLGGAVISRHVAGTGVILDNARRFFSGYGRQTGEKWKEFLDVLCRFVQEHNCGDEVIAGAVEAFVAIEVQMRGE